MAPKAAEKPVLNLNSYLSMGLYALFAWMLLTLHNSQMETATFGVKLDSFRESSQRTEHDIAELRLRIANMELDITRVKVKMETAKESTVQHFEDENGGRIR